MGVEGCIGIIRKNMGYGKVFQAEGTAYAKPGSESGVMSWGKRVMFRD